MGSIAMVTVQITSKTVNMTRTMHVQNKLYLLVSIAILHKYKLSTQFNPIHISVVLA